MKVVIPILASILILSTMGFYHVVFADDDKDEEVKNTKTLESECAKKKPTSFDGLFCLAIFNLQSTIDSFFDIFVELGDTANVECPDDQYAVGTGVNGELICAPLPDSGLPDQRCPVGQTVVGINSDGTIICEPIIPDCSGNGTFDFDTGICVCDAGFDGESCERPADCSDLNSCSGNGLCVSDGVCQCESGFGGADCSEELLCTENNDCEIGEACSAGTCFTLICPEIFDPVCGVDGITYGNECHAIAAHVDIAHTGICP